MRKRRLHGKVPKEFAKFSSTTKQADAFLLLGCEQGQKSTTLDQRPLSLLSGNYRSFGPLQLLWCNMWVLNNPHSIDVQKSRGMAMVFLVPKGSWVEIVAEVHLGLRRLPFFPRGHCRVLFPEKKPVDSPQSSA